MGRAGRSDSGGRRPPERCEACGGCETYRVTAPGKVPSPQEAGLQEGQGSPQGPQPRSRRCLEEWRLQGSAWATSEAHTLPSRRPLALRPQSPHGGERGLRTLCPPPGLPWARLPTGRGAGSLPPAPVPHSARLRSVLSRAPRPGFAGQVRSPVHGRCQLSTHQAAGNSAGFQALWADTPARAPLRRLPPTPQPCSSRPTSSWPMPPQPYTLETRQARGR